MRPDPGSSMRAMTRAQCLDFHDKLRTEALQSCRSSFIDCMVERGADRPVAYCAAGLVVTAMAPSPASIAAGLLNCGERADQVYSACKPQRDACVSGREQAYRDGINLCSKN
jgi:hypothetical protein